MLFTFGRYRNWELHKARNMWLLINESVLFFTTNADCLAEAPEGRTNMKQTIDWKISIYQSLVLIPPPVCDSLYKVQVQPFISLTRDHDNTHTHTLQQLTPCLLWPKCVKLQWKRHWQASKDKGSSVCVCASTSRREKESVTHSTNAICRQVGMETRRKTYSLHFDAWKHRRFYNNSAWESRQQLKALKSSTVFHARTVRAFVQRNLAFDYFQLIKVHINLKHGEETGDWRR